MKPLWEGVIEVWLEDDGICPPGISIWVYLNSNSKIKLSQESI